MAEYMRLDKLIASQRSDLSRRDVKELVRAGKVTVDGITAKSGDMRVDASEVSVEVDGEPVNYKKYIYIMLNKPQGVVCSTRDGLSPTVLSLIPEKLRRNGLFPAGRLDKDTEGFVLITDDGGLAHRMLSPKSHVPKLYYAELERAVGADYQMRFSEGITIDGGEKCLPAGFEKTGERSCLVTLHEGKYHQIKRMFEALGNSVVYLRRDKIGALGLDPDLPLGECMEIMHKDVEKLTLYFDTQKTRPQDFGHNK